MGGLDLIGQGSDAEQFGAMPGPQEVLAGKCPLSGASDTPSLLWKMGWTSLPPLSSSGNAKSSLLT